MAKKAKAKAKSITQLVVDLQNCLTRCVNRLDAIRATRGNKYRATDPCAAEQAVYDAAVQIATDLFNASVIAVQIATVASMELMNCRMRNP